MRTLRIESLESRQLLSAAPWMQNSSDSDHRAEDVEIRVGGEQGPPFSPLPDLQLVHAGDQCCVTGRAAAASSAPPPFALALALLFAETFAFGFAFGCCFRSDSGLSVKPHS